jgi:hypothetical protein
MACICGSALLLWSCLCSGDFLHYWLPARCSSSAPSKIPMPGLLPQPVIVEPHVSWPPLRRPRPDLAPVTWVHPTRARSMLSLTPLTAPPPPPLPELSHHLTRCLGPRPILCIVLDPLPSRAPTFPRSSAPGGCSLSLWLDRSGVLAHQASTPDWPCTRVKCSLPQLLGTTHQTGPPLGWWLANPAQSHFGPMDLSSLCYLTQSTSPSVGVPSRNPIRHQGPSGKDPLALRSVLS